MLYSARSDVALSGWRLGNRADEFPPSHSQQFVPIEPGQRKKASLAFPEYSLKFQELGLSEPLLRALEKEGYAEATPIQARAIPEVLRGRDLLAAAQTGTGKTAAFTLPLLQNLEGGRRRGRNPRALVLTPTRELAAQVEQSIRTYGAGLNLSSTTIFGGVGLVPQIKLLRKGVDILVATPGRLLDHLQQGNVSLEDLEVFVLDEADRMLDMGFIHDVKRILRQLPAERQNLLFSATFSGNIEKLARSFLNEPVQIDIAPRNAAADTVTQYVVHVETGHKRQLLAWLISQNDWQQVLVFTRTKHGANRLCKQLETDGLTAAAIHGNKSQSARTQALAAFKAGKTRVLVATDIAARGIDIDQLPHVINYELPNVPEDYVHRIGRTGRAGVTGEAVALVDASERKLLRDIQRLIRREVPELSVDGFQPRAVAAEDRQEPRANRAPKPNPERRPGAPRRRSRGGGANARRKPAAAGGRGGNRKTSA